MFLEIISTLLPLVNSNGALRTLLTAAEVIIQFPKT